MKYAKIILRGRVVGKHKLSSSRRRKNPIKSKSQWRALYAKQSRGEISKRDLREMVSKTRTRYARLPERVKNPTRDSVISSALKKVREFASDSSLARLNGNMREAGAAEAKLDRIVAQLERAGYADEAFEAEESGREIAMGVFDAARFGTQITRRDNPTSRHATAADFRSWANRAERMTDAELLWSIRDAQKAAKLTDRSDSVYSGFKSDEASTYQQEMNSRRSGSIKRRSNSAKLTRRKHKSRLARKKPFLLSVIEERTQYYEDSSGDTQGGSKGKYLIRRRPATMQDIVWAAKDNYIQYKSGGDWWVSDYSSDSSTGDDYQWSLHVTYRDGKGVKGKTFDSISRQIGAKMYL